MIASHPLRGVLRLRQTALQSLERASDLVNLANTLNTLGSGCLALGRLDTARRHLVRALQLARRLEDDVLAGMVLGFAKAIGEFGATITFVSNIPGETQTISSAIYSLIQTPDGDAAAARLVFVSIAIAMAALIGSEWFARRATRRLHGN